MPTPSDIFDLTRKLAPEVARVARWTPVEQLPYLSTSGKRVFAKREDQQPTGSFKIRGAAAKIASLDDESVAAGVVAASTGNHGLAVAHAASLRGADVVVYVPSDASPLKIGKIEEAGARVREVAGNAIEAEHRARREAHERGQTYISPYNDAVVVAGQGTIGLELRDQMPGPFTLVASVGGGGLVSGTAAALSGLAVTTIGTSPAVDAAMAASVAAGEMVDVDAGPTLSDGTAGNLEHDTITFGLCRDLVDEWVLQSEAAIARAATRHLDATGATVEGSAALALATADQVDVIGDVVVIICGGNA